MADDTLTGLTREQAAAILMDASPGARVVGVERMDGGIETGAYEVLCADPLQNSVVKVYAKDEGWKLLKEIGVYRLLRENAITQVPKLLGGAGPNGVLGLPYLVMSKLPGTTVAAISGTMPDAELADVYRQMGSLLASVHAIGQDAYGYLTTDIIDPQPSSEANMKATLNRVSQSYLDTTGDRELYEAAHSYLGARGDLFALCRRPVLLHNDFHEGNVIVAQTPEGPVVSGLIDVENAMAGDPVADLAKTHSYSIRGDRVKLDALFEGYGEAPVEWERRFRLFELVQSFELWDFFRSVGMRDKLDPLADELRAIIAAD